MKKKQIEVAFDVFNSSESLASLGNPMHWSILIVLWKFISNNFIKAPRKETRCNQIDVSLSVKNLSLSLMSTTHLQFLTGLVFQLQHNRYISESFLLCHWKWLTYLYNLYADAELNSTELLGQDHQCSSWKLLHISETVFLAIEALPLYCPRKISSLICLVWIDETNLSTVKKGISLEF